MRRCLAPVGLVEEAAVELQDTAGRWSCFGLGSSTSSPLQKNRHKKGVKERKILTHYVQKSTQPHGCSCTYVETHLPAAQDGWPVCVWDFGGPAARWLPSRLSSQRQSLELPSLKHHRKVCKMFNTGSDGKSFMQVFLTTWTGWHKSIR